MAAAEIAKKKREREREREREQKGSGTDKSIVTRRLWAAAARYWSATRTPGVGRRPSTPRRRPGRSIDDQLVRSLPPSWKENAEKIPTPSPIRFLAINKRLFEKIGIIFFSTGQKCQQFAPQNGWGIHFFRLSHFRCLSDCCLYLRKKRKRNVIMPSALESPTENCHWNMKIGRKNRFSKACFKKSLMVWSVEAHLKIASHFVPIIPFSGFLIKSCVPISSFE